MREAMQRRLRLRAPAPGTARSMTNTDKAKNKIDEMEGRARQVAGAATGDASQQRQGRVEEAKANLKQAGEKVKDALHRD